MEKAMRILGIDPGYAIMGYGVVELIGNKFKVIEYGSIMTESRKNMTDRLKHIYYELMQLINRTDPDVAAIEELFFNTNTTTAIKVGQARGVSILASANSAIETNEYTPLQVKMALTGYGRADKKQVQHMTKTILNLKEVPKPDDTADALAIAICHGHSNFSGYGF